MPEIKIIEVRDDGSEHPMSLRTALEDLLIERKVRPTPEVGQFWMVLAPLALAEVTFYQEANCTAYRRWNPYGVDPEVLAVEFVKDAVYLPFNRSQALQITDTRWQIGSARVTPEGQVFFIGPYPEDGHMQLLSRRLLSEHDIFMSNPYQKGPADKNALIRSAYDRLLDDE